jgi:hypothetical protein
MRQALLCVLGAVLLAAAPGCASDEDDDGRIGTTSRRGDDRIISRDPVNNDRYEDGRQARWPETDARIPAGARIVGEMERGNIVYRARDDGKLYLYDSTDREVIWSARIRDGEDFVFSPAQGEATLDRRPVGLPRLGAGHGFTIYFLEDVSR